MRHDGRGSERVSPGVTIRGCGQETETIETNLVRHRELPPSRRACVHVVRRACERGEATLWYQHKNGVTISEKALAPT